MPCSTLSTQRIARHAASSLNQCHPLPSLPLRFLHISRAPRLPLAQAVLMLTRQRSSFRQGINAAIDSRHGSPVYRLPKQPEFLFSEEAAVHRRSLSENLTFYTGSGYLTGAVACRGCSWYLLAALPAECDFPGVTAMPSSAGACMVPLIALDCMLPHLRIHRWYRQQY